MKDKIQEAAEAYAKNHHIIHNEDKQNCIDDFTSGANWALEQHKEQLQEALKALDESKDTIQWMWDNMTVDDKNMQQSAFNLPANALSIITETIQKLKQ